MRVRSIARNLRTALSVGLLAAALTSCSLLPNPAGGGNPGTGGTSADGSTDTSSESAGGGSGLGPVAGPCSFVDAATMTRIFALSDPEVTGDEFGCDFESADDVTDLDQVYSIGFDIQRDNPQAFETARELGDSPSPSIPGVGDDAFWGSAEILYVRKGDDYFLMSGLFPEQEGTDGDAAIVEFARAVVANL